MSKALTVPTARELEALGPKDRWALEDALDEIGPALREFNDEELRRWVEVEGKTLTWVGEQVGRSTARISQRCSALGVEPDRRRGGRPRGGGIKPLKTSDDTDAEVVEGEVVEGGPPQPVSHIRDLHGPDGGQNVRERFVIAYEECLRVEKLLDAGRPLAPKSDEDAEVLRRTADHLEVVATRIRELL